MGWNEQYHDMSFSYVYSFGKLDMKAHQLIDNSDIQYFGVYNAYLQTAAKFN